MSIKSVKYKALLILILCCTGLSAAIGQQVEFRASAREQVAVGDQFRLIFTVNAQANGFKAPPIKDFSILSGPNQGTSSSMQIINNQVTRSVEYSYTYVLQAIKEGSFTIGAASVNVDGKTHQSNPITITVVKGNAAQQNAPDQGNQQSTADISSKNLFVKASVSKSNPYQGEQVIVTYKIYTRVPVSEYSVSKTPSLTGFWTENLIKENTPLNQYREVVNGAEYVVAEFKKDALFAQKSGRLSIEPLELDVVAQVEIKRRRSSDPFDDFFNNSFFGSNYQNVRKKLYSNPVVLNVKPLPESNAGNEFTGAVGNFTINTSLDKRVVKANDALTLKFTVSGTGNLKLIDKPAFVFPTDFEVYDPRIIDDIRTGSSGVSGKRTFEFLLVPRNHGKYTIKPISFVWFDHTNGTYKTSKTPAFDITVEKGTGSDAYVKAGPEKEDFQYIGTDIRYINMNVFKLRPVNRYFFGSPLFWVLFALPIVLFILFLAIWQKELKRRGNVALMKNKKATGVARKRLKAAERYLKIGEQDAFCHEVSTALWGYMSDKFDITRSVLSHDSVAQALRKKNISEPLITRFLTALNNCEYARFAPGSKTEVMGNLYTEAMDVITSTEQELKK